MRAKAKDSLQRCRDYAFLLLKFRLRTVHELYQRLKNKKFADQEIRQTLDFLKEKNFLDDRLFARLWFQSRLKKNLGLKRIIQELKQKGVSSEVIKEESERFEDNYSEEQVVRQLCLERLSRLKGIDPVAVKRRVFAYLSRRGFSPDIITQVVRESCKQTA